MDRLSREAEWIERVSGEAEWIERLSVSRG